MSTNTAIRSLSGTSTQELADHAIHQIKALRALEAGTGTITRKSQNRILQSLDPDVLVLVAMALQK